MSHYTVGVFIKGSEVPDPDYSGLQTVLEDLMGPYDENLQVAPYVSMNPEDLDKEMLNLAKDYPDGYKIRNDEVIKFQELTRDEFAKIWYEQDLEDGCLMTTYNPDSKWDWYVIGGRWSGKLLTKDGKNVDFARIKDIDFDTMSRNSMQYAEKNWNEALDKSEATRYWMYGIRKEDTKESYIARQSAFTTFAVLTSDKGWIEPAKMGWFASTYDRTEDELTWAKMYKKRFIDTADPDDILVIVDCHI